MAIQGCSHVAVGVTDMDRSLVFYRDVLGLRVDLDVEEGAFDPAAGSFRRRAVYLRAPDSTGDPHDFFMVLDQQLDDEPFGRPPRIFQVGTHHFSLWVDDLSEVFERAVSTGHRAILRPTEAGPAAYGEQPGSAGVLTAILKDPDGNPVQLDQRL